MEKIEQLAALYILPNTLERLCIFRQLEKDRPLLELYCMRQGVSLIDVQVTDENYPKIELMYVFDDNLGGYTIDGIRNSL